jgi:hypothetical protein
MTGDAASAGGALKLLSSNPFLTDEDRAREYLVNLVSFAQAMRRDLGTTTGGLAFLLPLFALGSLAPRRTRALGVLCLGGAIAFALLVSWNGAARYQNFRDYMPPLALMLFAAALGGAGVLAARSRALRVAGALAYGLGLYLGGSHVAEAARLYARASRNIHDQQVAAGRRLAAESASDAIVLVGDAGAIPYFSRLHAVDALGLGGYHRLPFVRAAVHGEAATLELIERLPVHERPTLLALYPNWFPGVTGRFGHLRGEVTITDNVICGGVTKGLYDADWSGMLDDGAAATFDGQTGALLDEVDVADVVSEEGHAYLSPAPRGGWTLFDVRATSEGGQRFDAGRVVPEGEEESFATSATAEAGAALVLRVDESACVLEVRVTGEARDSVAVRVEGPAPASASRAAWHAVTAVLPVAIVAGDRVHVRVVHGSLHDFHAWLLRAAPGKP